MTTFYVILRAMTTQKFHLLNAMINVGIGAWCLGWTRSVAESLGIAFTKAQGLTDFRATYGGLILGIGVFFAFAVKDESLQRPALWLALFLYVGLGGSRLFGIFLDGSATKLLVGFLIAEIAFAAMAAWLLRS